MELKAFIQLLENEFQVEDEHCTLQEDTQYRSLGVWSSMLALIVIVQITDTYDVVLDEEDIKRTTTVRDLYELVKQKQQA